jgi:hypothetical protein
MNHARGPRKAHCHAGARRDARQPVYGGSDYIGIKRNSASVVKGIGIAPLAIAFAAATIKIASESQSPRRTPRGPSDASAPSMGSTARFDWLLSWISALT